MLSLTGKALGSAKLPDRPHDQTPPCNFVPIAVLLHRQAAFPGYGNRYFSVLCHEQAGGLDDVGSLDVDLGRGAHRLIVSLLPESSKPPSQGHGTAP